MNPPIAVACKPALVLPEHEFSRDTLQQTATLVLGEGHRHLKRVQKIIDNSGIERRFLVQPLVDTITPHGFGVRNDIFIAASKDLGERAALAAMKNAGVEAADIDLIIYGSCSNDAKKPRQRCLDGAGDGFASAPSRMLRRGSGRVGEKTKTTRRVNCVPLYMGRIFRIAW